MKSFQDVAEQEKHRIQDLKSRTRGFLETLDCSRLGAILLSGSMARGDYWPGSHGGLVDLTVLPLQDTALKPEDVFGPDEEPDIPFHCVSSGGLGYQIAWLPLPGPAEFSALDEARKAALLESEVLFEESASFSSRLPSLQDLARREREDWRAQKLGYVGYLRSDYKEDRWLRREAYLQLHSNLDLAIRTALVLLYYRNGRYAPAEDRRLYYALALPDCPPHFEEVWQELHSGHPWTRKGYEARRSLFMERLLPFV